MDYMPCTNPDHWNVKKSRYSKKCKLNKAHLLSLCTTWGCKVDIQYRSTTSYPWQEGDQCWASCPGHFYLDTYSKGSWVGPRAGLGTLE